ncbi:hypothetical protein AX14_004081 [Amanita brunnescens Koide BX004]|nr:hypothetical protein AX14_004081 [Amanita brunnescens Koide BX004]
MAARGVSPGSMISPKSQSKSLHPIWDPPCISIEENKVPLDNFVFMKNCLGLSFCAIYKVHNKYIPFGTDDALITKSQNPQREKVNKWLSKISKSDISPPDIIEISNHHGKVVEMYQLPGKEVCTHTPSPKGKGKDHARQSDEHAAFMADLTQAICYSYGTDSHPMHT